VGAARPPWVPTADDVRPYGVTPVLDPKASKLVDNTYLPTVA
jgi:hypothetical protein